MILFFDWNTPLSPRITLPLGRPKLKVDPAYRDTMRYSLWVDDSLGVRWCVARLGASVALTAEERESVINMLPYWPALHEKETE